MDKQNSVKTSKFRPGIAFTMCTDQLHLPKNGRERLKVVSKIALKKSNTNFRLGHSQRKNRPTFSHVSLLPEIFHRNDPKSRALFTFQPDFPETFWKL